MALPENLEIASTQTESFVPVSENPVSKQVGEVAVVAILLSDENSQTERHGKVHDPHQMSRHRAREAGRRLLF